MKIECNDIVVFKTPGGVSKSRVSKVDGSLIKLLTGWFIPADVPQES
ncbi:MAG: hypothetical protein GX918_06300 [Clostridiales bacterium]|nr:hypothetical protein [Clostridiales bacterium]